MAQQKKNSNGQAAIRECFPTYRKEASPKNAALFAEAKLRFRYQTTLRS
jgi:hypothetical protein